MTSEYCQRQDAVVTEVNNNNRRLDRLYDARETGMLKLEDLGATSPAMKRPPETAERHQVGAGKPAPG